MAKKAKPRVPKKPSVALPRKGSVPPRGPVDVTVVLVSPKEDGNVGAVARVMSNFDSDRLIIVNPRAPLKGEARRRAMGGMGVLRRLKVVKDLGSAVHGADLVVGTTDLASGRTESYLRRSMTPSEWGRLAGTLRGRIAIVFGPEDNGLNTDELRLCDIIVSIPTNRVSPTLNLSHAAAIVLYETFLGLGATMASVPEKIRVSAKERKVLFELLDRVLADLQYPLHKRHSFELLMRRILGRSAASKHEVTMLLGFMRKTIRMAGKVQK